VICENLLKKLIAISDLKMPILGLIYSKEICIDKVNEVMINEIRAIVLVP